jgi:hypothetical protein
MFKFANTGFVPIVSLTAMVSGCAGPVETPRCIDIPAGYVYTYDRPYQKFDTKDPSDLICPGAAIVLVEPGDPTDPPPPPNPPPVPNTPQGSVAGGGVAAAVEGEESSYAGGGLAGADDGYGSIDVEALRPVR